MTIELPHPATLRDLQRYVHDLEALHGWLDVDLVHNCFLMGEEMGELFRAVRDHERLYSKGKASSEAVASVAEEIVDVLNYLLAIANRLGIDVEEAFRDKNLRNQERSWGD